MENRHTNRQRNPFNPTKEHYEAHKQYPVGKAYAFFYCNASSEQIESEIPHIRHLSQTPSELELSLLQGIITQDSDLLTIMREAREVDINYVMEATYPHADNKKTADELATILNTAYASPLYKDGEEFRGQIVYEEDGQYIFRE